MKQSKVNRAVKASGDDMENTAATQNQDSAENQDVTESNPSEKTKPSEIKITSVKAPQETEKDKDREKQKADAEKDDEQEQPDEMVRFQVLEWHILTLAGSALKKEEKQERLDKMLVDLKKAGADLKKVSRKTYGLSAKTVDTRIDLTDKLANRIIESGKQFEIKDPGKATKQTWAAMNNYEAGEWHVLEQSLKAKAAAQGDNGKQQALEQENLFKSAHKYYGAAEGLFKESEKVGIPKEVVQMRTEQRLNHMGDDPDLKDMRNPSPDAYALSAGAAFFQFCKELVDKLAEAIRFLMRAKSKENADSKTVEEAEANKEDGAADPRKKGTETQVNTQSAATEAETPSTATETQADDTATEPQTDSANTETAPAAASPMRP